MEIETSACFLFQTDVIAQNLIDPASEALTLPFEKRDDIPVKFEGDGLFVRSLVDARPECIIEGRVVGIRSGHSLDFIIGQAIDAIAIRFGSNRPVAAISLSQQQRAIGEAREGGVSGCHSGSVPFGSLARR